MTKSKSDTPGDDAKHKSSRRPRRMAREPKVTAAADAQRLEGSANAVPQSDPADQLLLPSDASSQGRPYAAAQTSITPPRPTKLGKVLDLLQRPEGATLADLVEATGWQPHTVRAALTGLRKKGHEVVRSKRDETTCYTVAAAVTAATTAAAAEA